MALTTLYAIKRVKSNLKLNFRKFIIATAGFIITVKVMETVETLDFCGFQVIAFLYVLPRYKIVLYFEN